MEPAASAAPGPRPAGPQPTAEERERRRALGRARVAESRRRAELRAGRLPRPKLPLDRSTRFALESVLVVVGACAIAFQLLSTGRLRDTTAFFVGLPMLVGTLTIQLPRTSSPVGQTIQSSVIFLAVVAPMLGEGSICLLMAAPLFIGVATLVVFVFQLLRDLFSGDDGDSRRRPHDRLFGFAWIALPLAWGWVERRVAPDSAAPIVVRSVATVDGTLAEWRVLVRTPVVPAAPDGVLLRLGFPLPTAYDADGDVATLTFEPRPMPGGEWRLARAVRPDGIDFVKLDDTTKISEWLELREHRVRVHAHPGAPGRVDVEQTTVFVPRLAPHWYFDTAERWAMQGAQRLAVASWDAARRRGAVPAAVLSP